MLNRICSMLAVTFLLIAMLACNLPGTVSPRAETQPTVQAPSNPGEPAVASGGACDNALYPVVAGATWSYSMSSTVIGNFTRTITEVAGDGFIDQDVFDSGITRTGQWKCDAGALIALNPGGGSGTTANVQTNDLSQNFKTTAMNGVTYPANIKAGDAWAQDFTVEGNQSINGQDIVSKNQTTYSCTAGGTESVTVPAGTFNAVRIECQVSIQITITMNGAEVPTDVSYTSTAWHMTGVGLVKSEALLQDGSTSKTELTAYNIP